MKKIIPLCLVAVLLSGCATYKFQKGKAPYDNGFVVARDNSAVLEYTLGLGNSVPDLEVAKERFKRRRTMVEYYYKQMGYMENRVKETFWEPAAAFAKLTTGVFRLPAIAVSDYRYEHDPAYKARVRRDQEAKDAREEVRVNKLKDLLREYVQQDLVMEESVKKEAGTTAKATLAESPKQKEVASALEQIEAQQVQAQETQPPKVTKEKKPVKKAVQPKSVGKAVVPKEGGIKAVIIARPQKGYSPLRVQLSGENSFSKYGRIIAYQWDFGDGDTSTKKNPTNTYWSTTYGTRNFTVTLTVNDNKGNSATTEEVIEVKSK